MTPGRMPSPKRSKSRAKIGSERLGSGHRAYERPASEPERLGSEPHAAERRATEPELFYIDASALVKLVVPEPETNALVAALRPEARLVASEIVEVELLRALRRRGGDAAAELGRSKLQSLRLLPLDRQIRQRACELQPTELRALGAIHIATALQLGDLLEGIYAYDTRLIEAARRAGLRVLAPGAGMT